MRDAVTLNAVMPAMFVMGQHIDNAALADPSSRAFGKHAFHFALQSFEPFDAALNVVEMPLRQGIDFGA